MTVLYVVAAEGGHCRVATSARVAEDLAALRRSTSLRLELVYAARPSTSRDHVGPVARRAAQDLAARRVCGDWYAAGEAEIVAAIERAMAQACMRLARLDPATLQHSAPVVPLRPRREA